MQWTQVDSKIIRFASLVVGAWFGGVLAAALSAMLWKIAKWALGLMALVIISFFVWFMV